MPQIVVGSPQKVISPRLAGNKSNIPGRAAIFLLPYVTYAAIPLLKLPADFFRPILGSVIGDDQFKVRIVLGQERLQSLAHEPLAVKDRHAYAHKRPFIPRD
jgi:hypothetical protein